MMRPKRRRIIPLIAARARRKLALRLVGEIAGQHVNPLLELAGELIEHLPPGPRQSDDGALLMQRPRDRPAKAAGRAGDERRLAGQIEHGCAPRIALFQNRPAADGLAADGLPADALAAAGLAPGGL